MKKIVLWGVAYLFSSTAQAFEVQYPLDNYVPGSFQGRVFGCCNPRHLGEDHAASPLTPVYAIADGQVLTAEASGAHCNFGMVVIIEHTLDDGDKFVSLYGHLSNREGYRPRLSGAVRKGEIIGYVGHSGGLPPRRECLNPPLRYDDENGDGGTHLHFAIRRGTPSTYPDGRYRWVYYGYAGRGQDVDYDAAGNPHGGLFTNPQRFLEELGVNDQDGDGYSVSEGDCMDSGETLEGVLASVVHPGAEEVCNYTDDNCDGTVDEGFEGVLEPCTSGVGACRREGIMSCTTDFAGITCSIGPGIPTEELCDEVDNDCDGEVDENFSEPLATESGHTPLGTPCSRGSEVCNNRSEGIFICSTDGATTRCDAEVIPPSPSCAGRCGLVCGVACYCPAGQTCGEICSASGCWALCTTAGSACIDTCPIAASHRCSSRSGYYNRCAPSFDADPCLEWGGDVFCNSDPYYSFCCYTSPDLPLISSEPRCYCP